MPDLKTWQVRLKERDLPTDGTERAVEHVTAAHVCIQREHFVWNTDVVLVRALHLDVVESIRLLPDGAA